MPGKSDQSEFTWLAWAGWRMRVPRDWRPIKIDGGRRRGTMMIGDKAAALVQVKWSRQVPDGFEPKEWLRRRLGGRRAGQTRTDGAPAGGDFDVLGWRAKVDSPQGAQRSIWYGYSPSAALLMEVLIHTEPGGDAKSGRAGKGGPGTARAIVIRDVLPSLGATRPDQPTDWAVFQVSFRTPPGMDVSARRFQAGHMCLLFEPAGGGKDIEEDASEDRESPAGAAAGCRLLLRQVYPIVLALSKRDLQAWMRSTPFPERRRFYPAGEAEAWSVESFGRRLDGLIRRGRKRLAWPLGWLSPRWTVRAAVRDEDLDRLLLAECDSLGPDGDEAAAEAVGRMNRAVLGRLDGV